MAEFYWFLGHEQFHPETLVRHAALAEQAGFDGVMVSEHFHPWVADVSAAGFAFATLAAIAQTTARLRLMTAVTAPLFRFHPAVVAQAAATIDRLSSGQFALGVGSSEQLNEGALGFDFPPYKERAARLQEAVEIMRRLLDGEKLNYFGQFYSTRQAKLYSPPLHPVPIYVAAAGTRSAQLAGKWAQGVITSVKNIKEALEMVITPAEQQAAGKSFTTVVTRWTLYAQDEEEAWRAIQPWRGLRAPSRATAVDPEILQQEADSLPPQKILSQYPILGSAKEYIEAYAPLVADLGANIVGIQTTGIDQEALIAMIGHDVLPALRTLIA